MILHALTGLILSLPTSNATEISCDNGRWLSPEFVLFTGGENCESRIAACHFVGGRSEGWYSFPISSELPLRQDNCSQPIAKPECRILSQDKEAWIIDSQTITTSNCSDMDIVCAYKGTPLEGWYAYPSSTRHFIAYAQCSNDE